MRAFIFDLDGTLVDSQNVIRECVDHAFQQVGLPDVTYCRVAVTQQDLRTTFEKVASTHGFEADERLIRDFIQFYRDYHEEEVEDRIPVFHGVHETLEVLAGRYDLAIATTKSSDQAERVVKKIGLDSFFKHIQGTDPGLRYKPAPDIILKSLESLGRATAPSVYMGDSLHDMHAARAAGSIGVGAAYGFAGDQALRDFGPDHLVYDIRELMDKHESLFDLP